MMKFLVNVLAIFGVIFIAKMSLDCYRERNAIKQNQETIDSLNRKDSMNIVMRDSVFQNELIDKLSNNSNDRVYKDSYELIMYAFDAGIQHIDIFLAQSLVATNRFDNELYLKYKNPTGMSNKMTRPTTKIPGTSGVYAEYHSLKAAVYDYYIWQTINANDLSVDGYYKQIQKLYGVDDTYIDKIKSNIDFSQNLIDTYNSKKLCSK